MNKIRTIILVITALLITSSAQVAQAGRYVLRYEEEGQVSVSLFTDGLGQEKILFRALPLTADRTPGPAVLRWNGVYVAQWPTPAYEWEFDLSTPNIPSLDGQLVVPWLKGDPRQRVDLRRLTVGVHTVEVYFASMDDRGRLDRNRTAAPATQFRVEEVEPEAAATTAGGQPMTPSQLDAALKQSYEQGATDGRESWQKEREQLLQELQKATDELNELRRKVALGSNEPNRTMPQMVRYIPIAWRTGPMPSLNDSLVLTDSQGKVVTTAKVVEVFSEQSRVWVSVTLPCNYDINGHTVQRPSRGGN